MEPADWGHAGGSVSVGWGGWAHVSAAEGSAFLGIWGLDPLLSGLRCLHGHSFYLFVCVGGRWHPWSEGYQR